LTINISPEHAAIQSILPQYHCISILL